MNKIFTPPPRRPTTRAADGLPRWRWTVAEIEKMAVGGYFREEEQFELVGGEIVPMSPKGRRHEIIRGELAFRFTRLAPDDVFVIAEPQFNLADDTYLNPDILVHPASLKTPDVRGADAAGDRGRRHQSALRPQHQGAHLCHPWCARILGHQ